ncbi:hypothetical protein FRC11_012421, partial [Ceratobasidium sp. 423]
VAGTNFIVCSACPANTEDEGVEMGTKEQNEDFRHTDFEIQSTDDEAKPEAQVPPPRKRPRDIAGGGQTSGTSRAPTRKKQVRGKQGRLAGLMNMPIDIFTEVRRVACISVWQSIHVVNPHLAWIDEERGGLAAMSTGHERTTLPVVTIFKDVLEMRETCKGKNGWKAARAAVLVSVNGVPLSIRSFVHRSWQIFPPGQKLRCYNQYVLSADVPGLLTEYEDMKQVNDKGALEAWTKARIAEVGQRRGESEALARFLDNLDNNREKELDELKEARRSEIERRVRELGWADEDIPSDWESEHHHAWNALINQPKPLTDRIWANLQPKLIPLLEARRVERLEAEHEERKSRRQDRLVKLFKEIKEKVCSPLLFIVPEFGLFPGSTRTYEVVDPHHVFPNLDYALAWPIVKNLYEADSTPEEMEAMFETHREEIEALVNEWRISVQGYFVKQAEANGAGLRPVLTNYYGDSGPYIHFSDDLKRLQRADSIFYTTSSSENQKSPLMYRSILCAEGLTWSSPTSPHASFPKSPTLEHIFWYPEAHEVARALLVNMGKPDVPYLEIRGYP